MADAASGAKATWNAFKSHWIGFSIAISALLVLALWYDNKNSGDLTKKVAGLPLIGKLFA